MRKSLLIYVILLLSSTSCLYTDMDSFYVDITSDYTPSVTVSSNLGVYDSVSINDSILFRFEIVIDTGEYYFSDLYIGNNPIYRSDTLIDSLWIAPSYVTIPGDYQMTLVSYFKSYSGSLADRMDAEFFVSDTAWKIKIYIATNK